MQHFDLEEIDRQLGDTYWSPVDVATVNDQVVRAAAIKGEYHWHSHEEDEMFYVLHGEIVIDTEEGAVDLKAGQGSVIPKGVSHRPRAANRAVILMFEPLKLKSRGD